MAKIGDHMPGAAAKLKPRTKERALKSMEIMEFIPCLNERGELRPCQRKTRDLLTLTLTIILW